MIDRDDIDALAGEYVLGTLDGVERHAVDTRRRTDPILDQAIRGWELRLAPLTADVAAVAPPADLLARIEGRLEGAEPPRVAAGAAGTGSAPVAAAVVIDLNRRLRRWQAATAVTTALAAGLAGLAVLRPVPPAEQSYVAAFVANDELPRFMLTIDLAKRELTIRPVGAERLAGRTYQLWIASDQLGPAPRSLGVLDDGSAPLQRRSLNAYDPNLLRAATFGVSIEPPGGSPTGLPSPGALHAKLLPVTP
jgi:anti-sigma-K factor RskA